MIEFPLARNRSVVATRHLLLLPTLGFAALTFLTQASRILDVPFRSYAAAGGLALVLIVAVWVWLWRAERRKINTRDNRVLLGVLALGLLGAVLASIYHLPDSDDYMMTPDAVHFISHPDDPLTNEVHYLVPAGRTINSIVTATSFPFEYTQALAAWVLRLPFLDLYHVGTVAVAGFTVPLALFLLISHFASRSKEAVLATLLVVAVVTLLGEVKYSPGTLSFTRLFQGKVVLLASGLPFFIALSLDYLGEGILRRWFYVAACATALCGLSSTAFFTAPMTALALGTAFTVASGITRTSLARMVIYGSSLLYPVVYGLYATASVASFRDTSSFFLREWPVSFSEQLALVVNAARPVTFLVVAAALALTALLVRGLRRRLLLLWVGFVVLLFLNPWVSSFWIENVTGPAIYWRVFHLIPVTALVGAVVVRLLEILPAAPAGRQETVVLAVAIGLIGLHFVPGSTSIFRRGGELGWPAYNLRGKALAVARRVAAEAPEGPMLASPDVAGIIGMLEGGHPQVHLREDPIPMWLPWSESERRFGATRFAEGDVSAQWAFEEVVASLPGLEVVVLRSSVLPGVADLLAARGFATVAVEGEYSILWK